MKDVLIISPRFPPANAADAHRVRVCLPFYRAFGWNPIVLTTQDESAAANDTLLEECLPSDVEIIRVPIWDEKSTRKLGFGQLEFRALLPLSKAGARLISERKIKVVFFSTTAFVIFILGPIWKKRFGCRLVYDYQDPWYHGGVLPYSKATAPGSWRKYRLTQFIARLLEPAVVRAADHIISVSQGYVRALAARYPELRSEMFSVLPFPASKRDYEVLKVRNISQKVFTRDGLVHWVYAGAIVPDMRFALESLFRHLAKLRQKDRELTSRLRIHFVGTSYAPASRSMKAVEPLARDCGIADLVEEQSTRLPYYETLALYQAADVVLLIGSESADYTASKLLGCALSGRPVLAICNQASLVAEIGSQLPCVRVAGFDPTDREGSRAAIGLCIDEMLSNRQVACTDEHVAPWLAEASTAEQCKIFDSVSTP